MVLVPAGPYLHGEPGRTEPIEVAAFEIDVDEVTLGDYRACVRAGRCPEPPLHPYSDNAQMLLQNCNWFWPVRDRHPMNCVTVEMARVYCAAVGKRLPTLHEWLKAARGGCEQRWLPECQPGVDDPPYPWGNVPAPGEERCTRAIERRCGGRLPDTRPVGTTSPAGDSVYGVHDMVGNVAEIVAVQDGRLYRAYGGAFWDDSDDLSITRSANAPSTLPGIAMAGFRCARTP